MNFLESLEEEKEKKKSGDRKDEEMWEGRS